MAVGGSLIVSVEVRITPVAITWRVRPSSGWGAVGGHGGGGAGVLMLDRWEDDAYGRTAEASRALRRSARALDAMAGTIEDVFPLPLG